MKRHLFPLIVIVSFGMLVLAAMKQGSDPGLQVAAPIKSAAPAQNTANLRVDMDFGRMPLYFIAKQGQMDGQVAYYVQGKGKTLYFTSEGLTIALNGPRKTGEDLLRVDAEARGVEALSARDGEAQRGELHNEDSPARSAEERWVVKLDFVGANPNVKPVGTERTEAVISYFTGKPEDWKTGLPTYSKIVYPDLWPEIDLVYYGNINQLKYEFIIHSGADPSQIRLAYRGVSGVAVNEDGRLEVRTPLGGFTGDVPVAYQERGGEKVDVRLAYRIEREVTSDIMEDGSVGPDLLDDACGHPETKSCLYGFRVGEYDCSLSLVLHPAILVYCGYIGGSEFDYCSGIAVDGSGNAYVTGLAYSTESTFPVTVGPDLAHNGGGAYIEDVFVAKIAAFSNDDLLGTWASQGIYYRNSVSGVWVKLASPATKITAGDLDGDWIDDLIGIWPSQGGVWIKYSKTGGWANISSAADWISSGDMNGDRRVDFLGTWASQGVYYRSSEGGAWVKMASPATQMVPGYVDDDLAEDLLGMWPSQGGVWAKYSKTGSWSKLSSTADWIGAGKMRQLGTLGGIFELSTPVGGFALGPSFQGQFEDLSEQGPLGIAFQPVEERNTVVGMVLDKMKQRERRPSPGESGFTCVVERNLVPQEGLDKEKPKQRRSRATGRNRR